MEIFHQCGAEEAIRTAGLAHHHTGLIVWAKTLAGWTPGAKIESFELGYIPHVRSGDRSGEVTFTVISDPNDGSRPKEISLPYKVRFQQFRDANTYVVLSLGSSAFVHLGDAPHPETGAPAPPDLLLAKQTIDILVMLAEKTKGNLTPEEDRFLDALLIGSVLGSCAVMLWAL